MKILKRYLLPLMLVGLITGPVLPGLTQLAVAQAGTFVDSGQSLGNSLSYSVALGDLDGDGDLDAFVGNYYEANKVWLNNGGIQGGTLGTFANSGQSLGWSWSESVVLGDLDGDGDLDAFVGNYQPNKVWLNNGTGAFTYSGQLLGSSDSYSVALGDLDGDSDLDAFVGNFTANKVWLNDGTGTFSDSGQSLGNSDSHSVALGDLDAFVGNDASDANKIWLNQGGVQGGTLGTFSDSGQLLGNSDSHSVALGDLDGDGDLDAFVANSGTGNRADKVWRNDGTGTFSDSGQSLGSFWSESVALGELDEDGDLDAFVGNGLGANKVWLNDGAGIFSDSGQLLGDSYNESVALGDLDGDGDLDAFVGNTGANRVWLNQGVGGYVVYLPIVQKHMMSISLRTEASQAASSGMTTRVSVATGGAEANGNSFEAAISANERYVDFSSGASNLVASDTNGVWDVFVHDRQTGQTERVSIASDGSQGDGNSNNPAISSDGRYVAFSSVATDLATDTNSLADVFVHDRQTGQTAQVSIAGNGTQSNGASGKPAISADGRFVAFESAATNLVAEDFNYVSDVFVHDRDTDEDGIYDESGQISTVLVSVSGDDVAGNGASGAASISADGRYVVFVSSASNLVVSDGNSFRDVFLHDRDSDGNGVYDQPGGKSTTLLSRASDGTDADDQSDHPVISADGGTVVFESFATNLVPGGTTHFILHIFAYNLQSGQATLVSIASDGGQGNDWSRTPDVSQDGRYVVFSSNADNLVAGDTNFSLDIFLHDRDADGDGMYDGPGQVSTVRVNVASDGSQAMDGQSERPAISDNGQATAFKSAAYNLVANDTNGFSDVFVHDQSSPASGADLSVTICCGGDRELSELWPYPQIRATFAVSVTNDGPDTAHNVTLDFVGSPTVVYTPTQGTCEPAPTENCDYGTLAPGETVSVTVEQYGWPYDWQALYQGSVGVMASAIADETDPDLTNNRGNAVVHYYICDNAHCILAKAFCRLLIHGWSSQVGGHRAERM